jgi:hypothetical protein
VSYETDVSRGLPRRHLRKRADLRKERVGTDVSRTTPGLVHGR